MNNANPDFQLVELECPNCHAPLQGRNGANILVCEYCGSQVKVVQKNQRPDGAVPVYDDMGRALIHTMMPLDWHASVARFDTSAKSGRWPWRIRVEMTDDEGDYISYMSPTEYIWHSEKMNQLMGTYGNAATQAAEPINRPFQPPAVFYQEMMQQELGQRSATARYMGQIPNTFSEDAKQNIERAMVDAMRQELARTAAESNVNAPIDAVYSRALTRMFGFDINGRDYRIAIYALVTAGKVSIPQLSMAPMMGGGLFGGLLGNLMGGIQQAQPQYAQQPPMQIPPQAQSVPGLAEDAEAAQVAQQSPIQDINWTVDEYFALIAPADRFEELYQGVFADIVANTKIDPALMSQRDQYGQNLRANLDASVRDFKAQGQRLVNQSMEYSRQQNAMMDARMDSWQRQSDAHHQAVMDRSKAMFGDGGSSMSSADRWSEAILGQNTYVDQYGNEHSVSNRWDEAWRNDKGEIIGTEKGVDPGYGWTKLDRK